MSKKPRLTWMGPKLVNGALNWFAPQLPYNFQIVQMPEGGYTASYMNLDNINWAGREIKTDPETGNITSTMRSPDELPPGAKHVPKMIGGGEYGAVYPDLEAAQAACEDQAHVIRREIRNAQVDLMLRKGAPKRP